MNRYSLIFIQLMIVLFIFSCGTLVKYRSGIEDLNYLKEDRRIKIAFDYSNMSVGKYADESQYVSERVKKKNKKEPGSGEEWKEKWYDQRETILEPEFIKELNYRTGDLGFYFSKDHEDAKYTAVVHIFFMEPGFEAVVVSKEAEIDAEIAFYESNDLSNPLTTFDALDIQSSTGGSGAYYNPGPGGIPTFSNPPKPEDYTVSGRLSQAYGKCGKELAKYIVKRFK